VVVRDRAEYAFPGPSRLVGLEGFPGLGATKVERLRCLTEAAYAGRLRAAYLRSMPVEEALARLEELPGVGPLSAELILVRGAGEPDLMPSREPRLGRAVAMAYGLEAPPSSAELGRVAEHWRPYRSWVALLLRTMLEEETGEISGARAAGRRVLPRGRFGFGGG
jgi:DNA-3-methyladenine glycosylase II